MTQEKEILHQWQWQEDGGIWKNYDVKQNKAIDLSYQNGEAKIHIQFAPSRSPGTHVINVTNKTILEKSKNTEMPISHRSDGWYFGETR